ncbi:MAG: acyl-CoA dehydrogenase family protein, partial [Candidatus Binatia bacterium]
MDFNLTDEQLALRDSANNFAKRYLAKGALQRAHTDAYPSDVARLMAEQGLLGITIRQEDGGQGGTLMDSVIAIETIALVCPRSADVVQAGNFGPI